MYVVLCLIVFGCQYQCNWLPGKTRLRYDLLCVEWDVKPYTLTHLRGRVILRLNFRSCRSSVVSICAYAAYILRSICDVRFVLYSLKTDNVFGLDLRPERCRWLLCGWDGGQARSDTVQHGVRSPRRQSGHCRATSEGEHHSSAASARTWNIETVCRHQAGPLTSPLSARLITSFYSNDVLKNVLEIGCKLLQYIMYFQFYGWCHVWP